MKLNPKNYAMHAIIALIVILMLVLGRQKMNKEGIEDKSLEESQPADSGSGFLEVESAPKDADIFVDGINKGKSPIVIGSVAAGMHDIAVKKEGYGDFLKQVEIKPGKRAFVEAKLIAFAQNEPVQTAVIEKQEEKENNQIKEGQLETTNAGKVNLGNTFLLYYDFSGKIIRSSRPENYDVFSKRYNSYLMFTRTNPAKISAINKDIRNVVKEDCSGASGELKELFSGQSLCIVTQEGIVAAIGGSWEKSTENAELKWKIFD